MVNFKLNNFICDLIGRELGLTPGPQEPAVPAGSSDPSIWIQPVASQHQARSLFSNQIASHGRHLVQRWHPYQQPKFNSCAVTIRTALSVTSASGQPYWSEGEGHRKCILVVSRPCFQRLEMYRERDNYQLMAQTVTAALQGEATPHNNRTQLAQITVIILKLKVIKGYILGACADIHRACSKSEMVSAGLI